MTTAAAIKARAKKQQLADEKDAKVHQVCTHAFVCARSCCHFSY